MAITTDPFVNADINPAFIPKFWTRWINRPLFPQATILNWALDLSNDIVGVDIVNIPNLYVNLPTVSTQSTQGAEITTQAPAATQTQFSASTHIYIAYLWGDADLEQVSRKYAISYEYARIAQNLIVQTIESALFALQSAIVSGTQIATVPASTPTGADVDEAVRKGLGYFSNKGIYQDELRFFIDALTYWNQFVGVTKYAYQYASDLNLIKQGAFQPVGNTRASSHGYVGIVYGLETYISPLVVKVTGVSQNLMLHRYAFAYAMRSLGSYMAEQNYSAYVNTADGDGSQGENYVSAAEGMNPTLPVRLRTIVSFEHRNLGWLATVDTVYGASVIRNDLAFKLQTTVANVISS